MGIWIRSQDKCRMGKCMELYVVDDYDDDYSIEGYSVDDTPIILGTYSTKEKAIKVLDMIQEHIANNDNIFRIVASEQDWVGEIITHGNNVFQMPRDIIIDDDEV